MTPTVQHPALAGCVGRTRRHGTGGSPANPHPNRSLPRGPSSWNLVPVDGGVLGLLSPIGPPNGIADSAGFVFHLGVDARGVGDRRAGRPARDRELATSATPDPAPERNLNEQNDGSTG